MTQYFEGRRGRFWQVPPNGSVAAQWAWPVAEAVGLAAFADPLEALGRAEARFRALAPLAGRLALVGRDALPAFLAGFRDAAFFDLGGLMRTCGAIPGRP